MSPQSLNTRIVPSEGRFVKSGTGREGVDNVGAHELRTRVQLGLLWNHQHLPGEDLIQV
jgi:hypothetical protein